MTTRYPMLAVLACAAALPVLGSAHGANASVVEYLYVEANEGSSAGGHVALRIDDRVFDFQNAELGTLRRRRTQWDEFRYIYSVRENRTIHVARFDVSVADRDAILERFNRRYLIQNEHYSVRESLRNDRELIEWLIEKAEGDSAGRELHLAPQVRGAGLFRVAGTRAADGASGLVALRERIRNERGADYLAIRIGELERELETLVPTTEMPAPLRVSDDQNPSSGYAFSDR